MVLTFYRDRKNRDDVVHSVRNDVNYFPIHKQYWDFLTPGSSIIVVEFGLRCVSKACVPNADKLKYRMDSPYEKKERVSRKKEYLKI